MRWIVEPKIKIKHEEIKEYLLNKINNKEILPFEAIESENELSKRFSVSRMTTRKVLDELVVMGILHREHGRGTFVSDRPKFKDLQSFSCFTEEANSKGLKVTTKVVHFHNDFATPLVASKLGITTSKKIWYTQRIRIIENKPYAYQDSAFLASIFGDCTKEILEGSIYYHLEHNQGVIFSFADQVIEACVADEKLAELLEVKIGDPLLKITLVSHLKDGKAFEYGSTYYRSDRFKMTQSSYRLQR